MIYCFSGTGNTLYVARMLAEKTGLELHSFTADELRRPADAVLSTDSDLIVWAFPTYSWGIPPVVRRLMREARFDFPPDALHVAVTTCGDDVGRLASMFRSEMARRDVKAGAVFSVQMPNTYVMMKGFDTDSEEVAERKIDVSAVCVDNIAHAIMQRSDAPLVDDVVKGGFAWLKTNVFYPWFVRFDMSPKGFRVDRNACVGCGKCVAVCPMDNVSLDASKCPSWGLDCAFCTACYHVCPRHAIEWKNTTRNKGQVKYFNK